MTRDLMRAMCAGLLIGVAAAGGAGVADYNVAWDSPSRDCHGSMPLGNGDISVNAWVEPSGDLIFYIGKSDSWDDNARLLKVGKVRVTCVPPLVAEGGAFRQELDLPTGTLRITTSNREQRVRAALWVDANHPVIEVAVDADRELTATASFELWRTNRYVLPSLECSDVMNDRSKPKSMHEPTIVEPDTVLTGLDGRIGWYHHNIKSVGPAVHAETQGMTGCKREDPLLHRTFGAIVTAGRGHRVDDTHLRSPAARTHRFSVHVLTQHPALPAQWVAAMNATIAATEKPGWEQRRTAHAQWWQAFWERSWIMATEPQGPGGRLIPANDLPILVGRDQKGQNVLRGTVAVVRVADRALTEREIAERGAAAARPAGGEIRLPARGRELPVSFTIEAWVKPEAMPASGGRIVDNITPGGRDGFLIDTCPGNSLRFIAGGITMTRQGCLTPGAWHHVAVTADAAAGQLALYLDGVLVDTAAHAVGSDAFLVSRGYALQRFVTACAGRGRYPIKFNGSLFTVPHAGGPGDGDYRRWGPGYWWQNTRLPYISLCASGDYELMEPLFRMYVDELLPVNRYRTKQYFGFEGAYYIECIHFWGDAFNESYGWQPMKERKDPLQQSGYHKWEWVSGPELAHMLLDVYEHTGDEALLKNRALPLAGAVMRFFDHYYRTNAQGRLVMHPAQAVETWWKCTNAMPELAGLHAIAARLLALPALLAPPEERAYWQAFRAKLPELPTREVAGGRAFAPAEQFADKRNCENPELYVVFPFRLASFNRPNAALAVNALNHRWDRGNAGWRQEDIVMAYLGLADEAKQYLAGRARNHDKGSRFPAFWGPNYDWVPDQDHGGILMKAFQAMLMQAEPATGTAYDGKIYLLPAWPKEWDVDFKLHAPQCTVVQGKVRGGRVIELSVTPEARRKDVVVVGGGK